jgi:3' exoribonuclease, RNase T-like
VRFFLDTEFSERGPLHPIQLISIGVVAEDGREFYAHSEEYDPKLCNDWVIANILPMVAGERRERLGDIKDRLLQFIGPEKPEFWGYYADYDWVVFCQMFGMMVDLPKGWPMYCRDIKQLCDSLGNPQLPKQVLEKHHALHDAIWNKTAYEFLMHRGDQ